MRAAVNFIAGLIFGLGLLISGLANPAKVQNVLDLTGTFVPSLILVMFGAVVVPPAQSGADLGLVFMDGGGAVHMCVHGTIGAVTALVGSVRIRGF